MDILQENRKRGLWFLDDVNCIYIPQGWVDEIYEVDEEDGPSVYGYGATYVTPNSACATYWYPFSSLESLQEITEEKAKEVHPELFAFLDRIDKGINEGETYTWLPSANCYIVYQTFEANEEGTDYIRFVRNCNEVLYYDYQEWVDDPKCVMGAIMGFIQKGNESVS